MLMLHNAAISFQFNTSCWRLNGRVNDHVPTKIYFEGLFVGSFVRFIGSAEACPVLTYKLPGSFGAL